MISMAIAPHFTNAAKFYSSQYYYENVLFPMSGTIDTIENKSYLTGEESEIHY